MGTLRLLDANGSERHQGEVFSVAYTPDGAFVLSGGWDGYLRLWDAGTGQARVALEASPKPLSCCAVSPDGQQWLSGSMEGLLTMWDGVAYQPLTTFVAHTRPISAICYSPDAQTLATSGWDRQVVVRKIGKEREGRSLGTHQDIVAGCRFTLDGKHLISWSYDASIKIWDLASSREIAKLEGHTDRIICLSLSPDGRHLLSGSRDSTVRLWDLEQLTEIATVNIGAEIRGCHYLLDAESIVIADAVGRLFLMSTPTFAVQAQTQLPFKVLCGDLSPSGEQLALGGEDGQVHFVALEGFEYSSLVVTATPHLEPEANLLDRFFGKTRLKRMFKYNCPVCRHALASNTLPTQPIHCPRCHRLLMVNGRLPQLMTQ